MKISVLGEKIRNFFASERAYEILDADPVLRGSTWTAGGCWVGAVALNRVLHGSELYGVTSAGIPQHVVVRYRGHYLDADGASNEAELIRRWRAVERVPNPKLVRGTIGAKAAGIPCQLTAVRNLIRELEPIVRSS